MQSLDIDGKHWIYDFTRTEVMIGLIFNIKEAVPIFFFCYGPLSEKWEIMNGFHSKSISHALKVLNTDATTGLSLDEVRNRLQQYGYNRLSSRKAKSAFSILWSQWKNPMVFILTIVMLLAFFFGDSMEGYAILLVIVISVLMGFIMEFQALRAVESLQSLVQTQVKVLRNAMQETIKSENLVPGDIAFLEAGSVVPADSRIIWQQSLAVKESILTGESYQIEKCTVRLPEATPISQQINMIFKGTVVVRGQAKVVVTAIGDQTELGKIGQLVQQYHKVRNPIEKRLNKLSGWLIVLTLLLTIAIVISGFLQGKDFILMLKTGIALAVAAIPEGLPIVATICLANGMVKLSKQKVIVKKLEAVQTLGETTIICTDKTGTLTEDRMTVQVVVTADGDFNDVANGLTISNKIKNSKTFKRLIEISVLCNNAQQRKNKSVGDTMEIALIDYAEKIGFDSFDIREQYPELDEIPFDADTKLMVTLHQEGTAYRVCAKGALEKIIESCNTVLTPKGIEALKNNDEWHEKATKLASEGLRILGFAYKDQKALPSSMVYTCNMTFVGIIGFLDPPRQDVKEAIAIYKDAGIKVKMITGDHPETAAKIARDIGLLPNTKTSDYIIRGNDISDFKNIHPSQLKKILNASIFARMIPQQKLDLISLFQQQNEIVGMIGDGVNDAPALKKADIGIAMGIRGTDAAKEVADVILMDDQFTSTELAIRQGRVIFENIRHFVVYLLSCNFSEIIAVAVASFSNLPLPLLPLQILFLNLVTDIFPALALGMGKGDREIMFRSPRPPSEPIIDDKHWTAIIVYGLCITSAVLGITLFAHYALRLSGAVVNNMAFYTLVLAQLLNVFNMPNRKVSFFRNEVTRNVWVWLAIIVSLSLVIVVSNVPLAKEILSLQALSSAHGFWIVCFGTASLILIQIFKKLGISQ